MAHSYGDIVVLVQKQRDQTILRTNAFVLGSRMHAPLGADRKPAGGEVEEHLDLAFPITNLVAPGQILQTRVMEDIFRPIYAVRAWSEDAWVGFEETFEKQVSDRVFTGDPTITDEEIKVHILHELMGHQKLTIPEGAPTGHYLDVLGDVLYSAGPDGFEGELKGAEDAEPAPVDAPAVPEEKPEDAPEVQPDPPIEPEPAAEQAPE